MSKTLLQQLREITVVVADTGDIQAIERVKPQDATTNPSLITAAAQLPQYRSITDSELIKARKRLGVSASDEDVVSYAMKRIAIAFGKKILAVVPGRVSTEVHPRFSNDSEATVREANEIIGLYEEQGISRDRILVKIASTWEGIRAAEKLEQQRIHCNLTLLFGIHQAIACAEAHVTLISPFVGRIFDWYKRETGRDYQGAEDPGVQSVTTIYNYYKKYDYRTAIMGASFRNKGQIIELAGNDLLTISPQLLDELDSIEGALERKLDPIKAKGMQISKIAVDKATFDEMHNANRMASEKLKEGIHNFGKAFDGLEQLLKRHLVELKAHIDIWRSAEWILPRAPPSGFPRYANERLILGILEGKVEGHWANDLDFKLPAFCVFKRHPRKIVRDAAPP